MKWWRTEVRFRVTQMESDLRASGLVTESSRTSHRGWPQILEWLQEYAEGRR